MTVIDGIDYSYWRPTRNGIAATGAKFVVRYLCQAASGKRLSTAEAAQIRSWGVDLVLVWEEHHTAGEVGNSAEVLAGESSGKSVAEQAVAQAKAIGYPSGASIYFAVDFDATPAQITSGVLPYFRGIRSTIGPYSLGAYGSRRVLAALFDAGLIDYGWQPYAWNPDGSWEPRAQLRQVKGGTSDWDKDQAVAADFGSWDHHGKQETQVARIYLPWRPAAFFHRGDNAMRGIVIHSVECPIDAAKRYADSLSGPNYFGSSDPAVNHQTSAHAIFGPEGGFEMVKPGDHANHVGSPGNSWFYGIEHCGYAAYTQAQWMTPAGLAELEASARWAAQVASDYSIPKRWLTDDEVRAGARGFLTHAQVSRCIGGTTHTDPGDGFPKDLYMRYVTGARSVTTGSTQGDDDMPLSDADLQKIADLMNNNRMLREAYNALALGATKDRPQAGFYKAMPAKSYTIPAGITALSDKLDEALERLAALESKEGVAK